jgi:hypothetical protein
MARCRARANRASIRFRRRSRGLNEDLCFGREQRHQPDCFWHVLRRKWADYQSAEAKRKRLDWVADGVYTRGGLIKGGGSLSIAFPQ